MKGEMLIIRYIFIFILAVSIIGFVSINIANSTILSKEYVKDKLQETGYYEGIYQEVQNNFENYVGQSGLDEDAMKDIVTQEKVKADIDIMIDNIYEGKNEEIDVDTIKENLRNKITQAMEEAKQKPTSNDAVDEFINTICNEYSKAMAHTEYEKNINGIYNKVLKIVQLGKKAFLGAIIVISLIILAICFRRIFKGFSSIGITLVSSGAFFIVVNIFVNATIKINTITVLNSAVSNSVREILNNIMSSISTYGFGLLAGGIVLVIVGNLVDSIMQNKRQYDDDEFDDEEEEF